MLRLEADTSLGELATRRPWSIPKLRELDLAFEVEGPRSLRAACRDAGLDPDAVVAELEALPAPPDALRWDLRSVDELLDHLLESYHRPLRELLAELAERFAALRPRVSGASASDLDQLREAFEAVRAETEPHLDKEESILFPWLRSQRVVTAAEAIRVAQLEHRQEAHALRSLAALARATRLGEAPPEAARALLDALERLWRDQQLHIHLENNVLFPRAMGL